MKQSSIICILCYQIIVSHPTLIAYIVLSDIALLACSIAQAAINLSNHTSRRDKQIPQLSSFPTLDFVRSLYQYTNTNFLV